MPDEIISSSIQLIIEFPPDAKGLLLQQKMGESSPESTVERAFCEFADKAGITLKSTTIPEHHLQGLAAIGRHSIANVQSLQYSGKIVVNLPDIDDRGWSALKAVADRDTARGVLMVALQAAHDKYVHGIS